MFQLAALFVAFTPLSPQLSPTLLSDARLLSQEPGLELRVLDTRADQLRLEQTYRGLRVLNTKTTAVLDANGRISSLDHTWKHVSGELPAVNVSLQQAMRTAFAHAGVDLDQLPTPTIDAYGELVVLVESEKPRLVYELPVLSMNPFDRITALVDATTGQVVHARNATLSVDNPENVFVPNPKTAPAPVSKTITTTDNTALKGSKIDTANCVHATKDDLTYYVVPFPTTGQFAQYKQLIELALGKPINWIVVPLCSEPHDAVPNQAYMPVLDETSAAAETDKFSEVNFYYHADRVANYFATPGAGNLNANFAGRANNPLKGTTNFMTPSAATVLCTTGMYTPSANTADQAAVRTAAIAAFAARGDQKDVQMFAKCSDFKSQADPTANDFQRFDNAFFMPALDAKTLGPLADILGNFRPYDSMIFGQGKVDFAYDASVIYHEYTHSVVMTLDALQDGITHDKWGMDYAPSAMNEGLADYFSLVLTPELDGCLGPYTAVLIGPTAACLRSLKDNNVCPTYLYGEPHHDSAAFSEALFAIRAGFEAASDKAEFDKAVFGTLDGMPNDAQFATFNTKLLDQMKGHGLSTTNAQDVLTAKNVLACERAVPLKENETSPPVNLEGTQTTGWTYTPGFVQYRLDVPAQTKKIQLSLGVSAQAGAGFEGQVGGLLGGLGQQETQDIRLEVSTDGPIVFTYPAAAAPTGATEVELTKSNKGTFEVSTKTDGPWYVALANYNQGAHGITGLTYSVLDKFQDDTTPPDR
jgi:hypothetical protein